MKDQGWVKWVFLWGIVWLLIIYSAQASVKKKILIISAGGSISSQIFLAMAKTESALNPKVVGDGGKAHGLFQIHEPAARDMGFDEKMEQLFNAEKNITIATYYLYWIYNKLGKNLWCSVSAFNRGMGNISKNDLINDCHNHAYVIRVKKFLKGESKWKDKLNFAKLGFGLQETMIEQWSPHVTKNFSGNKLPLIEKLSKGLKFDNSKFNIQILPIWHLN